LNTKLTETEKKIYNTHLKYSRNGQAYTPRKDFSGLDASTILFLKKINIFFGKFEHISCEDYFKAPLLLHPDEKYPHLGYFITRPAIKTYSLAMKKLEDESPENQIEKIKESIRFITMFCLQNRINIDQYLDHRTFNMPTWMQHYREHTVNPYALIGVGSLDRFLMLQEDEKALWAGNFFEKYDTFRIRFYNSKKTKELVTEAYSRMKIFLKKELQFKTT
jgi:hypothetical protein